MNTKMKKNLLYGGLLLGIIGIIIYIIMSLTYKGGADVNLRPSALPSVALDFGTLNINLYIIKFSFDVVFKWYGVFIMGGVTLCSLYGYHCYLKKLGIDVDTVFSGVTGGVIFGVFFAHIWYIIFEPGAVTGAFLSGEWLKSVLLPVGGGLAIHGAVFGLSLFVIVFCRYKKLKIIEVLEIVLPVVMLAQVIGRWGNFFNQEAYGPLVNGYQDYVLTDAQLLAQRETLRHLLVPNFIIDQMYITSYRAYHGGITGYYHPTFLYEGVLNLIGFITYTVLRKKTRKIYVGDGICFYLIWYGIVRTFIEMLRQDPLVFTVGGVVIKTAILTSVIFIVVGVLLLVLRRVKKFKLISTKDFFENGTLWLNEKKAEEGTNDSETADSNI